MLGLDAFGHRNGDLQALRDVRGDMIPAHADGIRKDHVLLHEDRNARRSAAHVDTGRAQLLLVLHHRRHARHIGRRRNPREFKVAALDAVQQVLHHRPVDAQQMHVAGQTVADLPARIAKPRD